MRYNIDEGINGLFKEGEFDGTLPLTNKYWMFTTLGDTIQEGIFIVESRVVATYKREKAYASSNWGEWMLTERI